MKKNYFKKLLSLMLTLVAAAGMLVFSAMPSHAADGWKVWTNETMFAGTTGYLVVTNGSNEKAAITGVTSNKPGVVSILETPYEDEGVKLVRFDPVAKKKGKAKLKVSFTTPAGEAKTGTVKITVKKYPKQIKSLKINGEKIDVKANKLRLDKAITGNSALIKFKLKKGWKISSVRGNYWLADGSEAKIGKVKKLIKKGKKIRFPEEYTGMYINVEMKKDNSYINYVLNLHR